MLKKLKREAEGTDVPHIKPTAHLITEIMPAPQKITLLMEQHIGSPCLPIVKKGDPVKVGSLIGKAQGSLSANIYSGVSGIVSGITPIISAQGNTVSSVEIEADGLQTLDDNIVPPVVKDLPSFIEAVRNSGMVGLGGAGFPTAAKLTIPQDKKIDTLVINAAECEPYLSSDDREILECSDTVLSGILAVKKYLNIPKVIIAIERNKPESIDLLLSLVSNSEGIEIVTLPSLYPQGAEKVLVEAVCKREIPENGLPFDIGVVVMNVTTVSGIGKFLNTGIPLLTKRLTVAGDCIATPKNVEVIIGTSIHDVIDFCNGFSQVPAKIITGGPMMGVAVATTNYPITKQNNGILAFSAKESHLPEPEPCIRCGRCISACPVGLSPVEICEAYSRKDMASLEKMSCNICMSCGVCSYVCPAKRLVSQTTSLAASYYKKKKDEEAMNSWQ